jgi:dihydrofolate reductase
MQLIAAVDRDWAIGSNNALLFRISADLRRFKELTMGHTLLMGRKTFDSLPGLLPGRRHAVLSADADFSPQGVQVCRHIDEMRRIAAGERCFVIGGGTVYAALLADCRTAYITKIDARAGRADAYFPNLDTHPAWHLAEQSPAQEENGLRFCFCRYVCG